MLTLVALIFPFLLSGGGAIVAGKKGAWVVFATEMLILAGAFLLLSPASPTSLTVSELIWFLVAIAYLAACAYLAGKFVSGPETKAVN
jgi:hypothetical protein